MKTDTQIERPETNTGGDRFAHYVRKNQIVDASVTGATLTALCGAQFVPSRDPENFPVCETCAVLYEALSDE